jgi:formylglycine-generating enzyme required for sulfatase activity
MPENTPQPPAPMAPPWLDRLHPRLAFAVAAGAGLGLGWWLLGALPPLPAAGLFLLALVGAVRLALQGLPLLAEDRLRPVRRPRGQQRRRLVPDDWWVSIPAGSFDMGSPTGEAGRYGAEGPVHRVQVSAFECLRFPVTRGLVRRARRWPFGRDDRLPQVSLSWRDAIRLCNRFSAFEGLRPCYRIDGEHVHWDREADGWRLLTEAEWEYACRAGTGTRWSFGDDEARLGVHAWFSGNAKGELHPVGRKRPNPWGLHDMHGLGWEWCWDWYGPYERIDAVDPTGPASGSSRVLRGGAFGLRAQDLRSAFRNWFGPGGRFQNSGFRCARAPRRRRDP